ncbi:GIY-YIG nuclease family protein [Belliella kenyensis]|uniref:GIY-YIG nuclease family protein n=1 Tax=Belliella kenyensis TaxID=1472724 RepID=A0ABV8EF34_9BACT|nr:GIY-YIG nuclease family protein [Belliella kenyensis]MCH7401819.1 GIY-YIG nuclease family protein [Belliella kenyensis]MDN3604319.1 GIY-YIG nuclease family protein [Belliella kenyensis]
MTTHFYILRSEKLNRYYSGITTLDPNERLKNHLVKLYSKDNFTQKSDDWIIFLSIACQDYSQARKLELHVKRMKSSKYIENMKRYPEMIDKLLERFKSF